MVCIVIHVISHTRTGVEIMSLPPFTTGGREARENVSKRVARREKILISARWRFGMKPDQKSPNRKTDGHPQNLMRPRAVVATSGQAGGRADARAKTLNTRPRTNTRHTPHTHARTHTRTRTHTPRRRAGLGFCSPAPTRSPRTGWISAICTRTNRTSAKSRKGASHAGADHSQGAGVARAPGGRPVGSR